MLLLIDERIGSKDLIQPLRDYGVQCELQHLEFADAAFIGRGIAGKDIFIGVELKETRDLISSLHSARFTGHQLPGLLSTYDRVWLLTEGIWRTGSEGILEVMAGGWRAVSNGKRPILSADLESWLLSQIIRGGIQHWHCSTRKDTIRFLSTLYNWWNNKDLDAHRSHKAIYQAPPDRASVIPPSDFIKGLVALVPKLGWDKAIQVEAACMDAHGKGSLRKLGNLSVQDLLQVDGIGKTLANRIHQSLGAIE